MSNRNKKKPLSNVDLSHAKRLKEIWLREKGDITQARAAEIMGFESQGAVSHYLNGRAALNVPAVLKFSSLLNVPPEDIAPELDYGWGSRDWDKEAEEHKDQARHQYEQSHGELKPYITDNQVQIPILNIEASGGMGAINDSELVTDNMTLEKSYLHEFGLPVDNLKIITIRGDSMSPELESGDLVLVHHVPMAAHEMHDGMFVVLIEEMLYIKRLQRLPGKRIKVISTNREAYDPFEVSCNDIDIIGRVVFAWRGKKF